MSSAHQLALQALHPGGGGPLSRPALERAWTAGGPELASPWKELLAFDLARACLAALPQLEQRSQVCDLLSLAASLPFLHPWPSLFLAVHERAVEHADAIRNLDASLELAERVLLQAGSLVALGQELGCLAITGSLAACPPRVLDWGPGGAWTVLLTGRWTPPEPVPDALALEEFRGLQLDGAASVFFCLPAAGTAWICATGGQPQPAQPQLLRLLALLVEAQGVLEDDEARESALGPGSLPAALDKAVSRCRRLLLALGFPGAIEREGRMILLRGIRVAGLVSLMGRRPDVRVRRASWGQELVGWVAS